MRAGGPAAPPGLRRGFYPGADSCHTIYLQVTLVGRGCGGGGGVPAEALPFYCVSRSKKISDFSCKFPSSREGIWAREERIDPPSRFAHGAQSTARHRVILRFAADITARAFVGDRFLVRRGSRRIAEEPIGRMGDVRREQQLGEKSPPEVLLLNT